ncbi:hypothetical protein Ahy_B08g090738 [Arachis hypogaea]|uniref:Uncharacterized protein n=1 Tax=Arachis hypogaea TaxID=3818 RepID=A0A444Y0P5_ARAHY|nr:hypothetical protein Ahy_B08g090738 [Arachis hypogaea]
MVAGRFLLSTDSGKDLEGFERGIYCSLIQIHYDHQVLLDYLISKDTRISCAKYLLRIFVAIWNVAGKSPPSYLNLEDWLHTSPPADIYVLGFQEIVPLIAGNILGIEDNGPARKWLALIRKTLKLVVGDLHGDLKLARSALEMAGVLSSDDQDLWTGGETVPPVGLFPNCLVQQKVLHPFRKQVGGTILSAKLAKERGWAINIGGGFHHCSAEKGGGFCAYADISLCIHFALASKKGKNFSFLGPFLFTSLFTLFLVGMMQMFFPFGPAAHAIYGGIGAMIFSGYIIYDTDNLIKCFTYDEYIGASVTLYLDILNLFLAILNMLREANN